MTPTVLPASWLTEVIDFGTTSPSASKPCANTIVTAVPLPMAAVTGGLPTPLMDCTEPPRISAMAVTPASNGTMCRCAGMVFCSDDWLKMMPSAVAMLPWPTETVKLGSAADPELPPWVTAQTVSDHQDRDDASDAVDPAPSSLVDGRACALGSDGVRGRAVCG